MNQWSDSRTETRVCPWRREKQHWVLRTYTYVMVYRGREHKFINKCRQPATIYYTILHYTQSEYCTEFPIIQRRGSRLVRLPSRACTEEILINTKQNNMLVHDETNKQTLRQNFLLALPICILQQVQTHLLK